jgi:hypothetical protein
MKNDKKKNLRLLKIDWSLMRLHKDPNMVELALRDKNDETLKTIKTISNLRRKCE